MARKPPCKPCGQIQTGSKADFHYMVDLGGKGWQNQNGEQEERRNKNTKKGRSLPLKAEVPALFPRGRLRDGSWGNHIQEILALAVHG